MTNRDDPVPPDQFDRVLREMRKLDQLVGEVQEHIDVARGICVYEAQRALNEATRHIELAQFYMAKAIAEASKPRGAGLVST